MFEVGFSELLVIFVLALVVLGPEKLPRLAAQVGRWIGRARAMAKQFRDQLEEEINVVDMKAQQKTWQQSQPPPAAQPAADASSDTASNASTHTETPHATATGDPPLSAGTPEDDTHSVGGHNSGPPPEPEAAVYQPPAYANGNGAHAAPASEPSTTSPHPVESAQPESYPPPTASPESATASDERPARPGDVITHTHERGI